MKEAKEKTKETQPKEAAATEAPKEIKPTEVKPSFYDKPEPTPPAKPKESFTQASRLCMNTTEYKEFIEAVKQQGGYVTETLASRGGQGLSVQYMLPGGKRVAK